MLSFLPILALLPSILAQQPPDHISVAVRLDAGEVTGQLSPTSKVRSWIGIPYAQSPPERFSPPRPPKPWSTPLNASHERASCLQQFGYPEGSRDLTIKIFSNPLPQESEDCLYVNVWSPSKPAPQGGWPVMFWIYGGNLQFGHGMLPIYRGENMAKDADVVVVTFNYRTNVFGFPGSPTLKPEVNNLGFLDQRLALDWVQKNIDKFNGDPSRVLLFGESAGGFSAKQIFAAPPKSFVEKAGDKPAFAGVILQSQASGVRDGHEAWKQLVEVLKCKNEKSTDVTEFECVKSASPTTIKAAIERGRFSFGPVEDPGHTFTKDIRELLKSAPAAIKKVPVIIGTNSDEGTPFVAIAMAGSPNVTLKDIFSSFIGGDSSSRDVLADALLTTARPLYDKEKYPTERALGAAIMTDVAFQCPADTLSNAMLESGFSSVRRYLFKAKFPKIYPYPDAGAYHGSEIELVFGRYTSSPDKVPEDDKLSKSMMTAWTSLAWGNKNSSGLKDWPELTKDEKHIKVFDVDSIQVQKAEVLDTRCGVLGPLGEVQGV